MAEHGRTGQIQRALEALVAHESVEHGARAFQLDSVGPLDLGAFGGMSVSTLHCSQNGGPNRKVNDLVLQEAFGQPFRQWLKATVKAPFQLQRQPPDRSVAKTRDDLIELRSKSIALAADLVLIADPVVDPFRQLL